MNSKHVRVMTPLVVLFVLVTVAYAGGWATITLRDMPDYVVAGKSLNLTFTVRQHGVTLLPGLKPSIRASAARGLTAVTTVKPTAKQGEYTAALTFPQPGDWKITIDSGFNASAVTLPAMKVISPDSPPPAPFSPVTRGARLFAAKGCIGCHRHLEINPERAADAKSDLTSKRFAEDYLKKFLSDPGIKSREMPNPNLKEEEVVALMAFINKSSLKTKQLGGKQ